MMLVWGVLIVCCIAVLMTALLALQLNRRLQRLEHQAEQQVKALKQELGVVSRAAIGVGQRLMTVEKKLNISIEKQQQLASSHGDQQPYNYAASLAEGGASAEQIMASCGVSEAEAKLLALLKNHADDGRQIPS